MDELRKIANARIVAEQAKLLNSLPADIEALKRKNAANGLLRSGNTILGVVALCSNALDSLGKVVLEQYRWAVVQSLLASQSWVEELVRDSPDQLQSLFDSCIEHVKREATLAGSPNAAPECIAKLEAKLGAISNDIALSLRASFAERKRGLIRHIGNTAAGWLSKLLGGLKP